jgi:ATP-binding cassette subfamily B protein
MLVQTAIRSVKIEYEILGLDPGMLQNQYILRTGAIMLLVSLVSVICAIVVGWIASRTSAGFARDVRKAVLRKWNLFPARNLTNFPLLR